MANIAGFNIPVSAPSLGIGSSTWFMIFIVFFVVILGSIAIYLMHRFKVYRYKINVFENISGLGFQLTYKDRARLIKLGDGGEEILYLLKKKVYRTAYGKKMGANTYWFAVGQDGYWYNVTLGDVDAKLGMLDIEPIDRDMRYMHVAIRKNIQDRYKKQNFMDKYGTYVMSGIFMIIMIIALWLLLDKIADISKAVAGSVDSSKKVVEAAQSIVASLDNLCGGSGLKPI
jgi:hypothetical protein